MKWLYVLVCMVLSAFGGNSLYYLVNQGGNVFFTQKSIAWSLIHAVLATIALQRGMTSGELASKTPSKVSTGLRKLLTSLLYAVVTAIAIMNIRYISSLDLRVFTAGNWFHSFLYGGLGGIAYCVGFSIACKPSQYQEIACKPSNQE